MNEIVIFTHNIVTANLENFFWMDEEYGWCFDWYENETERAVDCTTYGLFPKDFIQQNGDLENKISEFLSGQPKENADIPVCDFFNWLNK